MSGELYVDRGTGRREMTPGQVVERARLNVENTATRIAARARAATTATVAASNGHAKHRPEVS